jgi:hypothetical protein
MQSSQVCRIIMRARRDQPLLRAFGLSGPAGGLDIRNNRFSPVRMRIDTIPGVTLLHCHSNQTTPNERLRSCYVVGNEAVFGRSRGGL